MVLRSRLKTHKAKLKKETNDDNSSNMQKSVTPHGHRAITSHFNVMKKRGQKKSNQGNVDVGDQNLKGLLIFPSS